MKRIVLSTMAAAVFFAAVGEVSALTPLKKIVRIKSAKEFKGRQSARLGKFVPFKPMPVINTGGQNLAAARSAIADAITKVKAEINDQTLLRKNYARQLGSLMTSIKGCKTRIATDEALKSQFVEELNTLKGISNPSAAIQQCITELEQDIAEVNQRIAASKAQMANLQKAYDHLRTVGKGAAVILTKLNDALKELQQAHAKVAGLKIPILKIPTVKMPMLRPVRPMTRPRVIRR